MSFKEASERLEGGKGKNEQKFMINMPCKYHKKGMCKLGKSCRFLHTNQKVKKTPTVNLPTTAEKTVCVQISKFGRRPFLQLVVLYASDARVSKYADEILEILLDAGIDVVVQNTVQTGFSPQIGTKVPKSKDIKAEHLAELICTSHADFLIVVGDKNMKNGSCQAKRKGKLLEMMVEDVISLIWKSWPQNPHKTLARIKGLTTEQTTSILFQYCGPKHISDRFEYLCTLKKEILSTYKIGSWCDSLEDKMTNLQKCAVTLHKQLKKAMKVLSELAVQVENPELSRGSEKTFEYKPSACRTPKSTIAYPLQIHLYCFIVDTIKSIEDTFDAIRLSAPMWDEYYSEHIDNWNVNLEELIRIRDEMWKALEEHEKSLLNSEEKDLSDQEIEDGMFSDLKDDDLDNELFSELESKPEVTTYNDSLGAASDPVCRAPTGPQPIKYPFSFPVATTAIFTPGKKTSSKEKVEKEVEDRVSREKRRDTTLPGIGRGSHHSRQFSTSREPQSETGLGRLGGMSSRGQDMLREAQLPEPVNLHRRGSTGGLEFPSEPGIHRDWLGRGSATARDRRYSDLMINKSNRNCYVDNRAVGPEEPESQRPITKEEKLLAEQLDRQLERRKDLQKQLEKEMEVERELTRQLEKRTQRGGEYFGKSTQLNDLDLGAPGLSNQPTNQPYNPFSSTTLSSLQLGGGPRRSSYVSSPSISPLPSPRLSLNIRDDDMRTSSRRDPNSPRDSRPPTRRESISGPTDEGYISAIGQIPIPRLPSFPFISKPDPQTQHSSYSQSGAHPPFSDLKVHRSMPVMREDFNDSLSMGTPFGEARSARSSSISLPPSPRLQQPVYPSDTSNYTSMRDLTLFPASISMYGSVTKSDPHYQQISKIWGTEKSQLAPLNDSSNVIRRSFDVEGKIERLAFTTNFSNESDSGDDSAGKEGGETSAPNSPTRHLPPKLTLQHGFVLKPDPVAST